MGELNRHRSLAHGRSNALYAFRTDISDGEHARPAGLEKIRRAAQWPLGPKVGTGLDEAFAIQRQAPIQPRGVGVGAGQNEHMPDVAGVRPAVLFISPSNPFEVSVAFESLNFGLRSEGDLLAGFDPG